MVSENIFKQCGGYSHIVDRIFEKLAFYDISNVDSSLVLQRLSSYSDAPIRGSVDLKATVNKDATIFIRNTFNKDNDYVFLLIDGKCSCWKAKHEKSLNDKGMVCEKISTLFNGVVNKDISPEVGLDIAKQNEYVRRDRRKAASINQARCLWYNVYIDGAKDISPWSFTKTPSEPHQPPHAYEIINPEPVYYSFVNSSFGKNKASHDRSLRDATGEELYLKMKGINPNQLCSDGRSKIMTVKSRKPSEDIEEVYFPMYRFGNIVSLVLVSMNLETLEKTVRNIGSSSDCHTCIGAPLDTRDDKKIDVIFCEGFASAWAAHISTGLTAVSLGGVSGAESGVASFLITYGHMISKAYILMDSDDAGEKASQRAVACIKARFPEVTPVELRPQCPSGCCPSNADPWDFLKNHNSATLFPLVEGEKNNKAIKKINFVTPEPKKNQDVEGLIYSLKLPEADGGWII